MAEVVAGKSHIEAIGCLCLCCEFEVTSIKDQGSDRWDLPMSHLLVDLSGHSADTAKIGQVQRDGIAGMCLEVFSRLEGKFQDRGFLCVADRVDAVVCCQLGRRKDLRHNLAPESSVGACHQDSAFAAFQL